MTNINDVFDSKHLKATDLKGKDCPATIAGFEVVDFDDGAKIVLSFLGTDKTLICNKTNSSTIADMYGGELDNWIGKKIVLFPTQTDFGGKQVACIRIRIGAAMPQNVQEKFNADPVQQNQQREEPRTDFDSADSNDAPF